MVFEYDHVPDAFHFIIRPLVALTLWEGFWKPSLYLKTHDKRHLKYEVLGVVTQAVVISGIGAVLLWWLLMCM